MITSKGICVFQPYIFYMSESILGHCEEVVQLKPGYIPGALEAQAWLKALENHYYFLNFTDII